MTDTERLHLTSRWDLALVPAGESVDRGLLVDVHAPPGAPAAVRRPVNLVLVLDRSGSMGGPPMAAVVEAAYGVIGAMDERDRLAVVCFDHEVDVIAPPRRMTADARDAARAAVRTLEARGSTDLAGGWFQGAECASAMLADGSERHAHVVVLSDGQANRGLQNPEELVEHAAALAARGVTTSAVGVGRNYSASQLEALARGGEGRLNHCDHGEDIVDVILGELMDERETVAQQLTLTLRAPAGLELTLLSALPHEPTPAGLRIRLGNLRAGAERSVALLATTRAPALGEPLPIAIEASWTDPETGRTETGEAPAATLRGATDAEVDAAPRDLEVAERILDLWEASLAYQGTRMHAAARYDEASSTVKSAEGRIDRFAQGTTRMWQRRQQRESLSRLVASAAWDAADSRTTMDVSRKALRQDADRRRDQKGTWRDRL